MTTAFGYACEGSASRLPFPIEAAHRLTRALDAARREGRAPWLSPDAQAQVAVEFRDRRPAALRAVALTMGATRPPEAAELRETLLREVVAPAFEGARLAPDAATRFVVEPAADAGGPAAHSGLTGRKTADDAYGAFARRGGAALSGKDPSRIDRIAASAARHAARAAVDAGLAREIEVQLSYVIGDEAPASVEVDSFGSGRVPDERLSRRLRETADLRVAAVAERMDLWNLPGLRDGRFYRDLAAYGHMGRDDLSAPWEDTVDLAARLA